MKLKPRVRTAAGRSLGMIGLGLGVLGLALGRDNVAPTLATPNAPALEATSLGAAPLSAVPFIPSPPVTVVTELPRAATASIANLQQGDRILWNGRTMNLPWARWVDGANQARFGLSDAALMHGLGADLLDTTNADRQPVQWFGVPIAAAVRRAGAYRYVDLTDLARSRNWQMRPNGTALEITAPTPRVTAIRRGRQPWGDRLVIDLDGPAPFQPVEERNQLTLALDANLAPALAANRDALPVDSTIAANRTVLTIPFAAGLRPRIYTLAQPSRIVIDLRADALANRTIRWAPSLTWRQQYLTLGGDRFPAVWLDLDPKAAGTQLRPVPVNTSSQTGIAPLIQTAQVNQTAAAINGGYFNRNNQLPLGALRRDGRWLSGPILNRGAIAWDNAGNFAVGRLALAETIEGAGQTWTLTHLNSGYIQAGLARYSRDWGGFYTPLTDGEIGILVQGDRVIQQINGTTAGAGSFPIPDNGYLLVARSFRTAANALAVGTAVRLQSRTNPANFDALPHILAAGPLLIDGGRIVLDPAAEGFSDAFIRERAARSGVGLTANGRLLIVAIHNRVGGPGPSLGEFAQLMANLGATRAVNLDGGSSTTLYLGGQLLDRPSRTAARVHGILGVFLSP
ncbi:MAG: phosphodiester glycosidase family protein [Cyanophyceae cyanobacterium]